MSPVTARQSPGDSRAGQLTRQADLAYSPQPSNRSNYMPIRTSSLTNQIQKNGARLHQAMAGRVHSHGADQPPSEQEEALILERSLLKEAKATRLAAAKLPKIKAEAVVKAVKPPKAPKAPKAAKEPKEAKTGKDNKPSRADKQVKKAASLEAAKKASKKSAAKT